MHRYTVIVKPEPKEGGFSVFVPSLPGCYTQGETLDEALANAKDAITLYLEDLKACGEPIPDEKAPPSLTTVEV
ncbi:MAG: type II toxin-antitoxin system HicB family antitoxin [Dehalococcoidia bacterium]|nr:type II toxin-antitoxin system HicB family antitoxin [Dehalococcoidia bacterium]